MLKLTIICLLLIVCVEDVACKKLRQEDSANNSDEQSPGKRTLMIGKFMLLPILAGVGIKFLVLLPVILSKITLLGILSFVSSNLSLLVSAIMGVKSYFTEDKVTEDEYDYDSRHKYRYETHHKDPNDDHYHYENDKDSYSKFMHHHKGYESSHVGSDHHHPEYRDHYDHKNSKKRFRPFKLLGRIRDAIKDHFHKTEDHDDKYRDYDKHYKHHSHDLHDDDNEYHHKIRHTKYKNSNPSVNDHETDFKGNYYEGYNVPENWSQRNEVRSNRDSNKATQHENAVKVLSGSSNSRSKYTLQGNLEEPFKLDATSNLTESTKRYKVYENNEQSKELPMTLNSRLEIGDSDSLGTFYNADYEITDFRTVQQADASE